MSKQLVQLFSAMDQFGCLLRLKQAIGNWKGQGMRLVLGVLLCLGSLPAWGQQTRPATAAEPGSDLAVYLITMGPGQVIYERFGHNAIWIHDRERGTDLAYNYGVFDMGESGFILRFLQGRMWYWVEPWDARRTLDAYKRVGRSVTVQRLNMTPKQRLALRDYLDWNIQPANSHYRYDYYTDNCSTRVRDALDRAMGGQIQEQLKAIPSGATYRSDTRRVMEYDPIMYTALYFVLGHAVDRPLSAWEECFLPMEMQRYLRDVTVVNAAGQRGPLVDSEMTVSAGSQTPVVAKPPSWVGYYLLLGVGIGALVAGLAWLAPKLRIARRGLAVVSGLWLLVTGVAGTFLAAVWLFSSHVAVYGNENILQCSPVALPLAVLVPALAIGMGWARRLSKWVLYAAAFVAGGSVVGLILQVVPAFYQVNGELIALVLPVNLALFGAVYWLDKSQSEEGTSKRRGQTTKRRRGGKRPEKA
ncbi:MAG TPA: DUF4105 domain-containing protein [Tepidisphaeraceae bacterium]|nr:DUF4105 domain-containing protein [Tepidisphaeraceae bacterium]